jgi:TDG/mug DNA glycosylase family protein
MSHILADMLRPGLRVVFCGTAAGAVSAAKGAYYAGPGNRFWTILAKTGLTPRQLRPEEFAQVLDFGIGLTDVAKTVSGADADLPADAFDRIGLIARMREVLPAYLAFNGKKAAATALGRPTRLLRYGPVLDVPNLPPVVVLPSTSGAASGFWDPAPWIALAAQVRAG